LKAESVVAYGPAGAGDEKYSSIPKLVGRR
jgi:hypothetical protein